MSPSWDIDRTRAGWWGLAMFLGGVLAYVVWSFIGTFVFGVFIYYATRPVYTRLKRHIRPPSLAAGVALLVLALPALLLLTYTLAIGFQEFTRFSQRYELFNSATVVQPYANLTAIIDSPQEFLAAPDRLDALGGIIDQAATYLGLIGTAALHLFVMIAIAFYLLRDDYKLSRWVRRRFSDGDGVLEQYLDAVDRSYHNIFFGNILNAALTATIGALSYNVLNAFAPAGLVIPYPTLLGLLTGVASLIPVVGMKLVYFPATAYLLFLTYANSQSNLLWFPVMFAAVSFVIVDTIPDLVLRPYVSGRGLHIGMVMLAYIFGPLLFGWYGIFLGPMLLVVVVHFVKLILPELIAGDPVRPMAVDPTYLTEPPPAESGSGTPAEFVSDDPEG